MFLVQSHFYDSIGVTRRQIDPSFKNYLDLNWRFMLEYYLKNYDEFIEWEIFSVSEIRKKNNNLMYYIKRDAERFLDDTKEYNVNNIHNRFHWIIADFVHYVLSKESKVHFDSILHILKMTECPNNIKYFLFPLKTKIEKVNTDFYQFESCADPDNYIFLIQNICTNIVPSQYPKKDVILILTNFCSKLIQLYFKTIKPDEDILAQSIDFCNKYFAQKLADYFIQNMESKNDIYPNNICEIEQFNIHKLDITYLRIIIQKLLLDIIDLSSMESYSYTFIKSVHMFTAILNDPVLHNLPIFEDQKITIFD